VITRMSSDPRTRRYVERRSKEGKSTAEIVRILKRYVAREVFKHLPRRDIVETAPGAGSGPLTG
jgi:hypothetical protein